MEGALPNCDIIVKDEYCVNETSYGFSNLLQSGTTVKEEVELMIEDTVQSEQEHNGAADMGNSESLQYYPSTSVQNLEVNHLYYTTSLNRKTTCHHEQSDRKLFTKLLTSWNIKKEKIKHLLDLGFMVNDLKIITNEDINDLFAKSEIVIRIRFRDGVTKLKEFGIEYFGSMDTLEEQHDNDLVAGNSSLNWSNNLQIRTPTEEELKSINSISLRHHTDLSESEDIEQLLLQTLRGKQVLKHYKKFKSLSGQHHKIITDIVVDNLINRGYHLKCSDFIMYAEKIVTTFPTENRDIYFIKGTKGNHRGKLVDRYYNVLKKLRKKGLWKSSRKTNSSFSKLSERNPNEITRLQLMTCSDWDQVLKKWNETFKYRMSINRQKSMMEICNYWTKYNDKRGAVLIELDYKLLLPGTSTNLLADWNRYIENWKHLFKNCSFQHPNDLFYRRLITEKLSDDTQNYLIFMLLHTLLPPNYMIDHVTNKHKSWRLSVTHSQNSIIIHVLTIQSNLTQKIDEIKTFYLKYGLDMHPFIVVVGTDVFNYSESFVFLNDHLHRTSSFLKSLDLCFKIYKIFYLEFPKESILVWQLIESLFYKINTDVTESSVKQLLLSLNNN